MAHNDGVAPCIIKQELNGEGNYASTNDDDCHITCQDVDLGLTLPPSDLLFDASCFVHDAVFQADWLSSAQEGETQESPPREVPWVHSLFDDYQLSEPSRERRRLGSDEQPLPTQEDESVSSPSPETSRAKSIQQPSAITIQTQEPSTALGYESHQSPADSGYGISILISSENAEEVNNVPAKNHDAQLPEPDSGQCRDVVPLQDSSAEGPPVATKNNDNTQAPEEDNFCIIDESEDSTPSSAESSPQRKSGTRLTSPSSDVPLSSIERDLPSGGPTIGRQGTRMPKGFGRKKLSRKEILKMGMSAGWFNGRNSSGDLTPQDAQPTSNPQQSIMDFPIPIAMAAALTPDAVRPAILETVLRTQSHLLHDPDRSSQPPLADRHFRQILEKLFTRYENEENLRNTLITFIIEKLVEGTRKSLAPPVPTPANYVTGEGEGESKRNTTLPSMDFTALKEDLAKMEKAINDIQKFKTQQDHISAVVIAFQVIQRNAAHIREFIAGQPYMLSLQAKNEALSKQVEGLAAKCHEFQLQKQYLEIVAESSKSTNPLTPTPVRMPPEPPSPATPLEKLPSGFVPDPNRLYRIPAPQSNTAWMCLLKTTDTRKRCEAINRTWVQHQENGITLWISRKRCVRCQQEHKSLATKYFLHEREVRQLGGITRDSRSQADLTKSALRTRRNVNPSPGQVTTLPPALPQYFPPSALAPVLKSLPTNPLSRIIPTPVKHVDSPITSPTNSEFAPQVANSSIELPIQAVQQHAASNPSIERPVQTMQQYGASVPMQAAQHPAASNTQGGSALVPPRTQITPPGQRKYVNGVPVMEPLTAPMGSLTLPTLPDPRMALNARLGSAVPIVPWNESERAILEGPWTMLGMPPAVGVYAMSPRTAGSPNVSASPHFANVQPPRNVYNPPYSNGHTTPNLNLPQSQPNHQNYQQPSPAPLSATTYMAMLGMPPGTGVAPVSTYSYVAPHTCRRSMTDGVAPVPVSNITMPCMPPAIDVAPGCPPYVLAKDPNRKRSLPDDDVVITGSVTSNTTTTGPRSSSGSSSDDSQDPSPKKRCRKIITPAKPLPKESIRKQSYAPIPKDTGETLRFCLPGLERSWMKQGGHPEQPISLDEELAAAPTVSKKKAPLPKKPAEPKPKKSAAVPVPVEEPAAVVEKPVLEEPILSVEIPTPVDVYVPMERLEDDDDDMDSLFGDDTEPVREMTDEVAEEWGAELEAMLKVTPGAEEQITPHVEGQARPVTEEGEESEEQ
jgi:hypothetical protein